jgi:hypothetical protein
MKELQEYAPLTADELDDAAFLSLQDLRAPKYHEALEQFMQETMEEVERDVESVTRPITKTELGQQSAVTFGNAIIPATNSGTRFSNEPVDYTRNLAFNRSSLEPNTWTNPSVRASLVEGYGGYSSLKNGGRGSEIEGLRTNNRASLGLYGTTDIHKTTSGQYNSGMANSKLQELNKTYQQYINYLQYQSHMKNYYQSNPQESGDPNRIEGADEDGAEEQLESAHEPECLVTMSVPDFYNKLLSLETSSSVYRGKVDLLISKIVAIQAYWRGQIVRQRLQLKQVFDKAATFLQAAFRGHLVRSRIASALRQLHKSVVEEEKRAALLVLQAQDETTGSGKQPVEDPAAKALSPFEEKLLALEEENKKMREKLDQQNELMLNLLASQNMRQIKVSNKLLSELKNDISHLKETKKKEKSPDTAHKDRSPKRKREKDSKKKSLKERSPKEKKADINTETKPTTKDQPLADSNSQNLLIQETAQETEQGSTEKSRPILTKEDTSEQIVDLGTSEVHNDSEIEHSQAKEVEIPEKNPDTNGTQDPILAQTPDCTDTIKPLVVDLDQPINHAQVAADEGPIKDSCSQKSPHKESSEECSEKEDEDSGSNEDESQDKNSSDDSENEDEFVIPVSTLKQDTLGVQDSEKKENVQTNKDDLAAHSKSFQLTFPLEIEDCRLNEEYEPPEDEFTAHLIDEASFANQSQVLPEEENNRRQLSTIKEAGYRQGSSRIGSASNRNTGYGGRSTGMSGLSGTSRTQQRTGVNYGMSSLNKSGSANRLGTSQKSGLGTSSMRDRPSSTSYSQQKPLGSNYGSTASKPSSGLGARNSPTRTNLSSSKVNSSNMNMSGAGKSASLTNPTGGGSNLSNTNPKPPQPSPSKPPTSAAKSTMRSMMGSITKTGSTSMYGRR